MAVCVCVCHALYFGVAEEYAASSPWNVALFTAVAATRVIIVTVTTNMSTSEHLLLILLDHMHTYGYKHADVKLH